MPQAAFTAGSAHVCPRLLDERPELQLVAFGTWTGFHRASRPAAGPFASSISSATTIVALVPERSPERCP
jgi:hypothetical protein